MKDTLLIMMTRHSNMVKYAGKFSKKPENASTALQGDARKTAMRRQPAAPPRQVSFDAPAFVQLPESQNSPVRDEPENAKAYRS
jgi:hypothetical protein